MGYRSVEIASAFTHLPQKGKHGRSGRSDRDSSYVFVDVRAETRLETRENETSGRGVRTGGPLRTSKTFDETSTLDRNSIERKKRTRRYFSRATLPKINTLSRFRDRATTDRSTTKLVAVSVSAQQTRHVVVAAAFFPFSLFSSQRRCCVGSASSHDRRLL